MKRMLLIPLVSILLAVPLACAEPGPTPTPSPTPTPQPTPVHTFTTTWGLGEKMEQVVKFSGLASGHTAGGQSEFLLRFENHSPDKRWQDRYCVFLTDRQGLVLEAARDSFDISPLLQTEFVIPVTFPADHEGPFGLHLLIPERGGSVQTVWVGERQLVEVSPWPMFSTCPSEPSEEAARKIAEHFVRNSPTFAFDGIQDSLSLVETLPDTDEAWTFVFQFDSRYAGYGDRTGETLLPVKTAHEAVITVERSRVESAVMDGKWDMIGQERVDQE